MSQSTAVTVFGSDLGPSACQIGPADLKDALAKVSPISRRSLRTSFFWVSSIVGIGLVVGARFILLQASRHRDCQTCAAV